MGIQKIRSVFRVGNIETLVLLECILRKFFFSGHEIGYKINFEESATGGLVMVWSAMLPAFLASVVEFVEAMTIVLVIGTTINWKSSLWGAAAGFFSLVVLATVFGTAIVLFIPLDAIRLVIGIILVLFGMQWLKKSVLRYSGLKALHDEEKIYEKNRIKYEELANEDRSKFNGFGFLTSFKSVLLEGLEVVFIVITFGTTAGTSIYEGIISTTTGAILALIVVASLGVAVRTPLTRIPENTLKYAVGIMLVTFGTFWAGEGLGINWPLSDLFLIALIIFYLVLSGATILWLKKHRKAQAVPETRTEESWKKYLVLRILWEVFDFFCGDWTVFWGVAITIALTILIKQLSFLAFALPVVGIIYMAGIAISLLTALQRSRFQ
jgi:uncharacterized membrane protein